MALSVNSTAFQENQPIPSKYTCDGQNISPPIRWGSAPEGTRSFALIAEDPDAPSGTFVHWVIYNIPANENSLPEGTPGDKALQSGAQQGTNDFHKIGYGGPCPPSGTHRYFFKLYALDTKLALYEGATRQDLEKAMQGHILAEGQLMGTYQKR